MTQFADLRIHGALSQIKVVDNKPTIAVQLKVQSPKGDRTQDVTHDVKYYEEKDASTGDTGVWVCMNGKALFIPNTTLRAEQAKWRADIVGDSARYLEHSSLENADKLIELIRYRSTLALKSIKPITANSQNQPHLEVDSHPNRSQGGEGAYAFPIVTYIQNGNDVDVQMDDKPIYTLKNTSLFQLQTNSSNYVTENKADYDYKSEDTQQKVKFAKVHNTVMAKLVATAITQNDKGNHVITFNEPQLNDQVTFTQEEKNVVMNFGNKPIATFQNKVLKDLQSEVFAQMSGDKATYLKEEQTLITVCQLKEKITEINELANPKKTPRSTELSEIVRKAAAAPITKYSNSSWIEITLENKVKVVFQTNEGNVDVKINGLHVDTIKGKALSDLQSEWLANIKENYKSYFNASSLTPDPLERACDGKKEILKINDLAKAEKNAPFVELALKTGATPIASDTKTITFELSNQIKITYQEKGGNVHAEVDKTTVEIFYGVSLAEFQTKVAQAIADNVGAYTLGRSRTASIPAVSAPVSAPDQPATQPSQSSLEMAPGTPASQSLVDPSSQSKEKQNQPASSPSSQSVAATANTGATPSPAEPELVTLAKLHNALESELAIQSIQQDAQDGKLVRFKLSTGETVTYKEQGTDVVRTIQVHGLTTISTTIPNTNLEQLLNTTCSRVISNKNIDATGATQERVLKFVLQKFKKYIELQLTLAPITQDKEKEKRNIISFKVAEGITISYIEENGEVATEVNGRRLLDQQVTTLRAEQLRVSDLINQNLNEYSAESANLVIAAQVVGPLMRLGTTQFSQEDLDLLRAQCSEFLKEILNLDQFSLLTLQNLQAPLSEKTRQIIFDLLKQTAPTKQALTSLSKTLGTVNLSQTDIPAEGAELILKTVTTPIAVNQKTIKVKLANNTNVIYEVNDKNIYVKVGETIVGILYGMNLVELQSKLSTRINANSNLYSSDPNSQQLVVLAMLHNEVEIGLATTKQNFPKLLTFTRSNYKIDYSENKTGVIRTITGPNNFKHSTEIPKSTLRQLKAEARSRVIQNTAIGNNVPGKKEALRLAILGLRNSINLQAVLTPLPTQQGPKSITFKAAEGITITYKEENGKVVVTANNGAFTEESNKPITLEKWQETERNLIVQDPEKYTTAENSHLIDAVLVLSRLKKIGTVDFTDKDFDYLRRHCSGFLKEILGLKELTFSAAQMKYPNGSPLNEETQQLIIGLAQQPESKRKSLAALREVLNKIGTTDFKSVDLAHFKEIYNIDHPEFTKEYLQDDGRFWSLTEEEKQILINIEIAKLNPKNFSVADDMVDISKVNVAVSQQVHHYYRPGDSCNPLPRNIGEDAPGRTREKPTYQEVAALDKLNNKSKNWDPSVLMGTALNYTNFDEGTMFGRIGYNQALIPKFSIMHPLISFALSQKLKNANPELNAVARQDNFTSALKEPVLMALTYNTVKWDVDVYMLDVYTAHGRTLNVKAESGKARNDLCSS